MDEYRGQCKPDDKPVLVLIRYKCDLAQNARNSLSMRNPLHSIYCGHVVGMGDDVQTLEGCATPRHMAISVLYFKCECQARMWVESTTDVKQPDWLNWVEIICVPLLREWDDSKRFIEVMDIKVKDHQMFDGEYVPQARTHLEKQKAQIGTVASAQITQFRGNWRPEYLVINQFENRENFLEAYEHDDYKPIKAIREKAADSDVIICQLDGLWRK